MMSKGHKIQFLKTRDPELSESFSMKTKDYNDLVNTVNFLALEVGMFLTHDIDPDCPKKLFVGKHPELFEEAI
ncbi:MAG: hypothetical protein HOG49_30970 [Candidatus Scalindua sp.]|nr:hypothetical protein [Candidatus Scalindua sp.]